MTKEECITRQKAIEILSRYSIEGAQIYLIDLIPLIEMIWADDMVQESEVAILNEYLQKHVRHINKLAGYEIITLEEAQRFIKRFLKVRPRPELLATLRSLLPSLRSTSDTVANKALRESLLATCLDIASIAGTTPSCGFHDRFDPSEKHCFFEILESLESFRDEPE